MWLDCKIMSTVEAIIIAIVEGITEFLPVSSTGHMIITSSLLHIEKDEFTKLFEVAIQPGAIMAVVFLYWKKFFDINRWRFYIKLLVAVVPALLLGFLFSDTIDRLLESPLTVSITLLAGGIILLFIDKVFTDHTIASEEDISYRQAFIIGCWQCISLVPGVSRSASTIIGGMQQKLTRKLAAEFSFFGSTHHVRRYRLQITKRIWKHSCRTGQAACSGEHCCFHCSHYSYQVFYRILTKTRLQILWLLPDHCRYYTACAHLYRSHLILRDSACW